MMMSVALTDVANAGPWETLHLHPSVLSVLHNEGFFTMTPVQEATIPLFLSNKDVAVEAMTGSGKTLAFVIPIVEMLLRMDKPLRNKDIGALIVTPTRELAVQIASVLGLFVDCNLATDGTRSSLLAQLIIGGKSDALEDLNCFRTNCPTILVGTPGRVLDVLTRGSDIGVRALEVLVLDEADRLLELGFEDTMNQILTFLPKQRRTGLFSATQTDQVKQLIRAGMRNPVRVSVRVETNDNNDHASGSGINERKTPKQLENLYELCTADEKLSRLVDFLGKRCMGSPVKVLVYFATGASVDFHALVLKSLPQIRGISLFSLHGKMNSKRRSLTFQSFRDALGGVLVCTDVAARGLDIPDVEWVVQFDPPQDPNAFIHRCGRTARIGKKGSGLCYLTMEEESYVEFLRGRGVPLVRYFGEEMVENVLPSVVNQVARDRALMEAGIAAFVSFIRSYKEHDLGLIFQFSKLDLSAVARAFALLRMPRMPEYRSITDLKKKGARLVEFLPPFPDIDIDSVPYADKTREAQRLVRASKARIPKPEEGRKRKKETVAWSNKVDRKEKRRKRADGKAIKRAAMEKCRNGEYSSGNCNYIGDDSDCEQENNNDWEELRMSKSIKKKLQQGKIAQEDFDNACISSRDEIGAIADEDASLNFASPGDETNKELPKRSMITKKKKKSQHKPITAV